MDMINQHKRMAMGEKDSGSTDVPAFPSSGRPAHPDLTAGTGAKGHMSDDERGVGAPIQHAPGHQPAQAEPKHGPMFERELGFNRDAKA